MSLLQAHLELKEVESLRPRALHVIADAVTELADIYTYPRDAERAAGAIAAFIGECAIPEPLASELVTMRERAYVEKIVAAAVKKMRRA